VKAPKKKKKKKKNATAKKYQSQRFRLYELVSQPLLLCSLFNIPNRRELLRASILNGCWLAQISLTHPKAFAASIVMLQLLEVFERPGTSLDIIVKHTYKDLRAHKFTHTQKLCDSFFSPVSTKQRCTISLSPVQG
jgi:hypothetical protein